MVDDGASSAARIDLVRAKRILITTTTSFLFSVSNNFFDGAAMANFPLRTNAEALRRRAALWIANSPLAKGAVALRQWVERIGFWKAMGILFVIGVGSWILNAWLFPADKTG